MDGGKEGGRRSGGGGLPGCLPAAGHVRSRVIDSRTKSWRKGQLILNKSQLSNTTRHIAVL